MTPGDSISDCIGGKGGKLGGGGGGKTLAAGFDALTNGLEALYLFKYAITFTNNSTSYKQHTIPRTLTYNQNPSSFKSSNWNKILIIIPLSYIMLPYRLG
ncbi:hypothetical protein ACJX0J_030316 [Zea mays]